MRRLQDLTPVNAWRLVRVAFNVPLDDGVLVPGDDRACAFRTHPSEGRYTDFASADDLQTHFEHLVIHAQELPDWEDLGSALRHMRFVRDQHPDIGRVAWAVDNRLAFIAPAMAEHFMWGQIKRLDAAALDEAIDWASGGRSAGPPP